METEEIEESAKVGHEGAVKNRRVEYECKELSEWTEAYEGE
jgi:hypothetical protein